MAISIPSRQIALGSTASKYLTLILLLFVALSPALFFTFGYHNDYNAWSYDTRICCVAHPETRILIAIGRYFGAFAQNLQFLTIQTVHDLWVWRLIGIVSTALLAAYYLYIVSSRREPTWTNVLLTLAVFTLPTMQFQALWVSMYMFWTPPILLGLIAAHLVLSIHSTMTVWQMCRRGVLAFAALLAGVFFYPASATFVLVPAAHLLVTDKATFTRWTAAALSALLGAAFIALFAIHKFVVFPRLSNAPYIGGYDFSIASSLVETILYRLREYLSGGASFWLGFDVFWFPVVVAYVALVAVAICILRIFRRTLDLAAVFNVLMAAGLFLVAAAPLVVAQQFSTTFRITWTMTAIELLVFFWLLAQMILVPKMVAAAFAMTGLGLAFASVYGVAAVASAEHALYARALGGLSPSQFQAIVVLRPTRQRQAFGRDLKRDFGGLGPIDHIGDLLIGTRYNGKAAFDITTFRISPIDGAPFALERNAVVIDTSAAYHLPNFKDFSSRVGSVSARPRGTIGPMYAVDGDINSFWEVFGQPFPIEFELILPAARQLQGYSLATREEAVRMPTAWELWISSDLQNWRRVHEMTAAPAWKVTETREFTIEPTPGVRGIRLVIKATEIKIGMRIHEFTPAFSN